MPVSRQETQNMEISRQFLRSVARLLLRAVTWNPQHEHWKGCDHACHVANKSQAHS
jgi:hypothetical protein